MENTMISKLKNHMSGNMFLRLFLAVFCPPIAVCDKGCFIFSVVFFLYFVQLTCICFVLSLIFSTIGTTVVAGSMSSILSSRLVEQLFATIPETCSESTALFFQLFFAVLISALYAVVVLSVFDFLIWFFSFFFHIPAALIAVIVCLLSDNNKNPLICSNSGHSRSWGKTIREYLILVNRIVLCYIFPPLAVADMGLKKMLFVELLTLCGWLPGVIAVFFLVMRRNCIRQQPGSVSKDLQPKGTPSSAE